MATTLPSNRRDALAQWWQLRTRSERTLLATAAGIVALALAWLVVWQPLAQDTDRLGRQIENDRATLADARRRADEIAGLARTAPSVAPVEPRAALDAVLESARLAIGRDQVIPPPRREVAALAADGGHVGGNGIQAAEVVQQPAVEAIGRQRTLDVFNIEPGRCRWGHPDQYSRLRAARFARSGFLGSRRRSFDRASREGGTYNPP